MYICTARCGVCKLIIHIPSLRMTRHACANNPAPASISVASTFDSCISERLKRGVSDIFFLLAFCRDSSRETRRMAGKECKPVLPYLQRAQEMEKHDPVVAYYCRLYALELGMKLPSRGEELRGLIGAVMKQLEADKAAGRGPGGSREEDQLHVEGFAQQIFAKADKVDRAGCATVNTARSFYAAAIFFEVLGVFGAVDEEVQHMQKYAAWKAADIQKAIREGRKPAVGPPKNNDGEEAGSEAETPPDVDRPQTVAIFTPGQRVFCSSTSSGIEQGAILKQEAAHSYLVSLPSGEQSAVPAASLAPFFEAGEALMYRRGGDFHNATLVKMDLSHWPPSYTIQFNGSEVHTEGFNLASTTLAQQSMSQSVDAPAAAPDDSERAARAPGPVDAVATGGSEDAEAQPPQPTASAPPAPSEAVPAASQFPATPRVSPPSFAASPQMHPEVSRQQSGFVPTNVRVGVSTHKDRAFVMIYASPRG